MKTETKVEPAKYSLKWLWMELEGKRRLPVRKCSLCGSTLSYVTDGENVAFDSNCDCSSHYVPLRQASWNDVVQLLEMQNNDLIRDNIVATLKGEREPE
jgi:hypothetical protein